MTSPTCSWTKPRGIKAAFFDVDGTLLSHKLHKEPETAVSALHRLKDRGIMPILATGRPSYMLECIDITPFEAYVTINGQYCYTKDQVIYNQPIEKNTMECVVKGIQEGRYDCLFQEKDLCFASRRTERVRAVEELVSETYEVRDVSHALTHDVYQLNAYLCPGEEHLLMNDVRGLKYSRWDDNFIDVMPCEGGKEKGISCMLEHFGLSPEEVICFGDGGNDIGMFELCGHSVAVGDAQDCIKERAEFITKQIEDDGIAYALEKLELI